jgi:hypothetical protein
MQTDYFVAGTVDDDSVWRQRIHVHAYDAATGAHLGTSRLDAQMHYSIDLVSRAPVVVVALGRPGVRAGIEGPVDPAEHGREPRHAN